MRTNLEHSRADQIRIFSMVFGTERQILAGDVDLTKEAPSLNCFDPGGADRIIDLPEFERGRAYLFCHVGTDNTLTVRDSGGGTVVVVRAGENHLVVCSGNEWRSTKGVFGPAGAGHGTGLVPDPGAVAGLNRFLMDDGTWTSVTTVGIVDAYKTMTDGSGSSVASGLTTFKLRSSSGKVSIAVTNNDATHGDNANFTVVEAAIDHDALLNYVADKHVAHSSVSITTAAGSGLQGGGTIAATRSLSLDIHGIAAVTPVLADESPFYDVSGSVAGLTTFAVLNGIFDHNALLNYSANRHIDHTGVSVTAGTGLSGGGTIDSTKTINLAINVLNAEALGAGDLFPFYDVSDGDHGKITIENLKTYLDVSYTGIPLTFSTSTTDSDPGTGVLRANHGTLASATFLYVDNTDTNGSSITAFLDVLGTVVNSTARSILYFVDITDETKYLVAKVTGAVTDGTGYRKIPITALASGSTPSNAARLTLIGAISGFDSAGGDMFKSQNLSGLADYPTARTNMGLGTGDSPEFTAINLGAATDTTFTRPAAGRAQIEGEEVLTTKNLSSTLTAAQKSQLQANIGALGRNRLINGRFQVSQRYGTAGTSIADNAHWADRWRYIGEANGSMTAAIFTGFSTFEWLGLLTFAGTSTAKGGIFQVVEDVNCKDLRGDVVLFSIDLAVSDARLGNVKMGIAEFTGTANATTGDPISAWGADGTTPTLAANWAFLNTPANLNVTTSRATYSVTGTVGASATNLAVLVWNDDKNYTANDAMYFAEAQLIQGSQVLPYDARQYGDELALCQRYYQSMATITVVSSDASGGNAISRETRRPVTMRASPTDTFTFSGYTACGSGTAYGTGIDTFGWYVIPSGAGGYNYNVACTSAIEI